MSSFFARYPFLPSARLRAKQMGIGIGDISEGDLEVASLRLRSIFSGNPDYRIFDEKTEVIHFVLFRIFVSALESDYYYQKLGLFYAERSKRLDPYDLFAELGIDPLSIPFSTYMHFKHIYPETKVYHMNIRKGYVYPTADLLPLIAGCIAYTLSVSGLPLDVSTLPKQFSDYARRSVVVRRTKSSSKVYDYIEAILSASGIPDGRKRIIYYWLAPYLVNIKGLSPDEANSTINDWLARQGGGKIQPSWVKDEVLIVNRKKIHPWGLKKVEQQDPSLVESLRSLGVLQ